MKILNSLFQVLLQIIYKLLIYFIYSVPGVGKFL